MGRGRPIKCKYLTSTYETSWRKRSSLSPLSLSVCSVESLLPAIQMKFCAHPVVIFLVLAGTQGSLRAPTFTHPGISSP